MRTGDNGGMDRLLAIATEVRSILDIAERFAWWHPNQAVLEVLQGLLWPPSFDGTTSSLKFQIFNPVTYTG